MGDLEIWGRQRRERREGDDILRRLFCAILRAFLNASASASVFTFRPGFCFKCKFTETR